MLAQTLVRGSRFHAEPLYQAVHECLRFGWPAVPLYPAVGELVRQLRRALAKGLARPPLFVLGTIAFNHAGELDEGCVEHFLVLEGPEPGAHINLLAEAWEAGLRKGST